ncbi:hypothetical protein [Leptolyngbya sp. FACHB-261]|nr:hypothetical protein [Leptolyngbya sp. FACHB-261]
MRMYAAVQAGGAIGLLSQRVMLSFTMSRINYLSAVLNQLGGSFF